MTEQLRVLISVNRLEAGESDPLRGTIDWQGPARIEEDPTKSAHCEVCLVGSDGVAQAPIAIHGSDQRQALLLAFEFLLREFNSP